MKPRLLVCMSGGRTSAYMAYRILNDPELVAKYEILIVFANTGAEDEDTLRFVNECDKRLGFNTVWLEAVVDPRKGKRTGYKVVTYETASRNSEPFIAVVKKYGIPNTNYLHCTREMKEIPIHGYIWDQGWKKGEYLTAIGMRVDEPKRTKEKKPDRQTRQQKVYPLAHWWPTTKEEVLDFWEFMEFDLNIPEHRGNCLYCHKKSNAKLRRVWQEDPGRFFWPHYMEERYGDVGGNVVPGPRKMYRGYRSTSELIAVFELTGPTDEPVREEQSGSCTEECSPFSGDSDYDDEDI